jgi:6-phosphofructokinase 1
VRIPDEALSIIRAGIPSLGEPRFESPLYTLAQKAGVETLFPSDEERVVVTPMVGELANGFANGGIPPSYEVAGPRKNIFFDPAQTRAAIVTCGGLCPGINDIIRRLVITLYYQYGVTEVFGIRFGYRGLVDRLADAPLMLRPDTIEPISNDGGTFLGSSRGHQDPIEMVDFLQRRKIQILFTIGGDGTQKGSLAISQEAEKRGYALSVVGLPKTIDSDIALIEKTFGFDTAVSIAAQVLRGAHVEAEAERNGVVIVKLMGRESGFLAVNAAIASGDVNFVLIPEVPFHLDGPNGFFAALKKRLERRGHALVVVAEGVAKHFFSGKEGGTHQDASGNAIPNQDVGTYLKDRITDYFREIDFDTKVRYIDPSYYVRSLPAIPADSIFCQNLAHNAVHAAMAGKTRLVVGTSCGRYCHIPLEAVVLQRRFVDPLGSLWRSALETTGQPAVMLNR